MPYQHRKTARKHPKRRRNLAALGMLTVQKAILAGLEKRGWRLVEIIGEEDTDWWTYEVWTLESAWSPAPTHVVLTFLLDPEYLAGPKRRWLTDVVASKEKLKHSEWHNLPIRMFLHNYWSRHLNAFLDGVDTLRAAVPKAEFPVTSLPEAP